MRALLLEKPGSLDHLRIGETDVPEPGPGEARVRVHACGLNPVDYKLAQGSGHPKWSWPHILGLDVAGVIDAVGPDAGRWQVGQRVAYHGDLSRAGGFAEYTTIPAHVMAPVPPEMTFEQAAALPCAGLTAFQALYRKLRIEEWQTILIQGGAGGVGGFAVQLAAYTGATVLTTASARNHEYVTELGAAHAIDYRSGDVVAQVMALTNGLGVDAIIDTVDSASATEGINMLAFHGQIACVAGLPDCTKIPGFTLAPSLHEIALGGAHLSGSRIAQEDLARMLRHLIELVRAGTIDAMLSEVVPLADVPEALHRLAGRHVRGKIVAQIDG